MAKKDDVKKDEEKGEEKDETATQPCPRCKKELPLSAMSCGWCGLHPLAA